MTIYYSNKAAQARFLHYRLSPYADQCAHVVEYYRQRGWYNRR